MEQLERKIPWYLHQAWLPREAGFHWEPRVAHPKHLFPGHAAHSKRVVLIPARTVGVCPSGLLFLLGFICLLAALLLGSCATPVTVSGKGLFSTWAAKKPDGSTGAANPPRAAGASAPAANPGTSTTRADNLPAWTSATRDRMMETLQGLMGKKYNSKAMVNGRNFTLDCIGTICAAWWGAGIDLSREYRAYQGNGVTMLWSLLADRSLLVVKARPEVGDVVFWDNTWDANEDGVLYNDGHTHAGVVSRVGDRGMVWYIHASVSRGVVEAFMNIEQPEVLKDQDGHYLNSPMYLGAGEGKKNNPPHWLSGDLYSATANARGMAGAFQGGQ